jgi:hypothetical protein
MIKDQPKVYICGQTRNINKRSQGRSHDNHSDYYRIPLALGLVFNRGQAFAWLRNLRRVQMENRLLNMIQVLELQLVKTDLADAWLRRIWQDKINELMLKVTRLTN